MGIVGPLPPLLVEPALLVLLVPAWEPPLATAELSSVLPQPIGNAAARSTNPESAETRSRREVDIGFLSINTKQGKTRSSSGHFGTPIMPDWQPNKS